MARTTPAAVRGVLLKDYDVIDLPSLSPFLDSASVVVNRVNTCATAKGITLTAAELELIERWLAAHFYATSDRPYQTKGTKGASASFVGQTGMYLEATYYGQTAINLDYSGCLAAIGKQQFASASWLGKRPSEQIPYVDRD